MLRLPDRRRLRVRDIVPELECQGEIEATRITEEGSGSPYLAEVYFTPVKMPKRDEQIYLCVFFCRKYKEAMVLMTTLGSNAAGGRRHPGPVLRALGH